MGLCGSPSKNLNSFQPKSVKKAFKAVNVFFSSCWCFKFLSEKIYNWTTHCLTAKWGKPQVLFFNMVLCHGLPHSLRLCIDYDTCMAHHGQQILKPCRLCRINRRKRTKCDQFFCWTPDFFIFCHQCFFFFFYHSFTHDVHFVDKVDAEICGHHSLFSLQFQIENLKSCGVNEWLNVAASWLNWSQVSGYLTACFCNEYQVNR